MPKKNDQPESTAELSRQAAVIWLLLKDEPRLSLDDAWRILLWLMRSRRHVYEFLIIRRQDARLTRMLRVTGDASKVVHVDWWQGTSSTPARPPRRCRRARWSIAATVLLMLSMALFLLPSSDETPGATLQVAGQAMSTRRLDDGSVVSADALASMRVDFTGEQRGVHLYHGKSLFDVMAGRERPFVVHTFLVDITSVGSSKFAVRIDTSVEVEVFKGMVEVAGRGAKPGSVVVTVKQGETYRVPVDAFRAMVAGGSASAGVVRMDGET